MRGILSDRRRIDNTLRSASFRPSAVCVNCSQDYKYTSTGGTEGGLKQSVHATSRLTAVGALCQHDRRQSARAHSSSTPLTAVFAAR
jgi:hypothetical protein